MERSRAVEYLNQTHGFTLHVLWLFTTETLVSMVADLQTAVTAGPSRKET